jgi:hypothetical protein
MYKFEFSSNQPLHVLVEEANKGEPDNLFEELQPGERAIDRRTGMVVEKSAQDFTYQILPEPDQFALSLFKRLDSAQEYKEHTAFKMIERTAKGDAYATAVRYLEQVREKNTELRRVIDLLKLKRDTHQKWVAQYPVYYEYATQTFKPQETGAKPANLTAVGAMIVGEFTK